MQRGRRGLAPSGDPVSALDHDRRLVRPAGRSCAGPGDSRLRLGQLAAALDDRRRDGLERLRAAPERRLEHLVHVVGEDELELLADLLGDVPQVLLVLLGQDDHARAGEVRGEDLGLEAADGQHAPAERDLAGHRHVLADGDAGERGDHRRGHGHAGRRAVLGGGAGRDVDVQRVLLEHLALDPELGGVRPDPGQGRPRGLAHDVAQLAGEDEVLLALHQRDLDGDDVAADLGHDEARRGPGLVLGLELAVLEPRRAEVLVELLEVDDRLALAALGHGARDLAHEVGELALEVPDAGLVGVGLDELREDLVRDLHVLGREAVVLHLLGDEEPARDLDLLRAGCSPAAG